jgi:hypothetical protein
MYQYYEAVRDAPKYSKELRQEMSVVCELIFTLEEVFSSASPETPFPASPSLLDSINEFKTMVNEMNARVTVPKSTGIRRLKWPFIKDENIDRLSRMVRYKASFSLAFDIKNAWVSERCFLISRNDMKLLIDTAR